MTTYRSYYLALACFEHSQALNFVEIPPSHTCIWKGGGVEGGRKWSETLPYFTLHTHKNNEGKKWNLSDEDKFNVFFFFLKKPKVIYTAQADWHTDKQADITLSNRQWQTDRREGGEGAIITCQPSRHHVHLGRVWLQHAIQLLLGCWIGRKVDRPVGNETGENTG